MAQEEEPAPAESWAPPPLALEVVTAEDGTVTVNGVAFESSLGLSADAIRALIEATRTSLDPLVAHAAEVQERVIRVLAAAR